MSLEEYQAQLADVEALISEAPEDESFLKLRDDLLELIALTKQEQEQQTQAQEGATTSPTTTSASFRGDGFDTAVERLENIPMAQHPSQNGDTDNPVPTAAKLDKKIKQKIKKPFEIPEHLVPLESDTEAQRNKKKRAIKALKSKHKAAVKEYETSVKQSAWLDFSKKKRKKGTTGESIFKTAEGGGKVGVVTVSSDSVTDNAAATNTKRQRHTF